MIKIRFCILKLAMMLVLVFSLINQPGCGPGSNVKILPGFRVRADFDEQEMTFLYDPQIRVYINAPGIHSFDPDKRVQLVIYTLPNGNTIEQTAGKKMEPGDDWHFDIQHIAAQTRFLRAKDKDQNLLIVYLEAKQKSWPWWKKEHPDYQQIIPALVDSLMNMFKAYQPYLVLNGHSGGGSFIFGYLNSFTEIPSQVKRIVFMDSNYGYDHAYGEKIHQWLDADAANNLMTLAYNDSVALYNGKRFVSDTGGTWYRSKMMRGYLDQYFPFQTVDDDSLIYSRALDGRLRIILKKNPDRKIFHTTQVERNGFIHGMEFNTRYENEGYRYFAERAYALYIGDEVPGFAGLNIPVRDATAMTGSEFVNLVRDLPFVEREARILAEITHGNIPDFLRQPVTITNICQDSAGIEHVIRCQVLPDYLAIGSDADFCRIPMGPQTAQKIADLFRASLPTSRLVDDIYHAASIKLNPIPYYPIKDQNEKVIQFARHSRAIDAGIDSLDAHTGQLIGGIKKDVILHSKINDPNRTHHVVIYGWHRLNGQAIQPATNIHIDTYVDYSHGIRLINRDIQIDGVSTDIRQILADPLLRSLISNEGDIEIPRVYRLSHEQEP